MVKPYRSLRNCAVMMVWVGGGVGSGNGSVLSGGGSREILAEEIVVMIPEAGEIDEEVLPDQACGSRAS